MPFIAPSPLCRAARSLCAVLALVGAAAQADPGAASASAGVADTAAAVVVAVDAAASATGSIGPAPSATHAVSGGPASRADDVGAAAAELVWAALQQLDVPYRRGGASAADGFDCSGFTQHVYDTTFGRLLPRRAVEQARAQGLRAVRRDALQPGDLVFFNTVRRAFSHVGIYIGDGRFIHAPRSGSVVRIESLRGRYWARRYNGARRAVAAIAAAGPQAAIAFNAAGPESAPAP